MSLFSFVWDLEPEVWDFHASRMVLVGRACLVATFLRPTPLQKLRLRFHRIAEESLGVDALGRIVRTGIDTARDG